MNEANKSMEAFFTRQKANEGVKLPLALPDGTETDHWLRIRGIDSDAFKAARSESNRAAMDLAAVADTLPKAELESKMTDAKLRLLASLVMGWSFEQDFTEEAVLQFLREAPQIADQIDSLAARRRLFFAQSSTNSTPSPVTSSS